MDFTLRAANVEDCKDLARMMMELSEHEKIAHKMKLTQKGHIKIGYAIYFYSWSSMSGRVIYMEDLYVMPGVPRYRKGIGKALMSKVAQLGLAAGCTQLNFAVLDWNKPSLEFYFHQGCYDFTAESGYHLMRCEGEALEKLAQP
ncbi:hypothetical protein fugu_001959 [Takifugu bimaculatus]|uniref:N-acetyltransferase domain-containing protein n=1 Tax=Takifugu bimaculatus TaxID=433685 RepID=A0A4Z2BNA6_9TELE|nr:hypothetical protein fugu_001959 [Takifugu bimaculatus]